MPFYHVAIAKKEGENRYAFQFDMTKEQIEKEIRGFLNYQQPFMCGSFFIQPSDVETFKISETKDKAEQILQETKGKRILKKTATRFFGVDIGTDDRYIDELSIINSGKDVTRDFVEKIDQTSSEKPTVRLSSKQNTGGVKSDKNSEVRLALETSGAEGEEWEKLRMKIFGFQGDIAPFRVDFLDKEGFKVFCDNLTSTVSFNEICITGYFSETIRDSLSKLLQTKRHIRMICPEFPLDSKRDRRNIEVLNKLSEAGAEVKINNRLHARLASCL